MTPTTDGPSPCGYHYVSEYLKCPRKFYLRNTLGLTPIKTRVPLVFGHAWHTGLEHLLTKGDLQAAIYKARTELILKAQTIDKPEDVPMLLDRLDRGLPVWWTQFRANYLDKGWTVQSVEETRMVPIADDLTFSVRFDGTITDPEGRWYILEHKTTGWSTDKTVQSVELGDQVTGYYLAFDTTVPERPETSPDQPQPLPGCFGGPVCSGVLLDITEFKASGINPSWWIITRTVEDQLNFELGLVGTFNELAQKTSALDKGFPPFELFPRSAEFCAVFGCEYENICRKRLEQASLPPTEDFVIRASDTLEDPET